MSGLLDCGICCSLLSIWAIIQLVLMGVFFKIEAITLFLDVVPKEYEDYDDFVKKVKDNYRDVAINCWIAAGIYGVTLCVAYFCVIRAKKKNKRESQKLEDDEIFCTLRPVPKKAKKIKEKIPKKEEEDEDDENEY